jgi:hypothetical protein
MTLAPQTIWVPTKGVSIMKVLALLLSSILLTGLAFSQRRNGTRTAPRVIDLSYPFDSESVY